MGLSPVRWSLPWAVVALLALGACGPAPEQAGAPVAVEATSAPTAPPAPPQAIEPAAAPDVPTSWLEIATVEGDYYVLGNPAAPVRLVDYSDFF